MRSDRGWPIIEAGDQPLTIYRALQDSLVNDESRDEVDSFGWVKIIQDAQGTLQDGFGIIDPEYPMLRPNGVATIYVKPSDLVLSLQSYAERLKLRADPAADSEIPAIDQILDSLDSLRREQ